MWEKLTATDVNVKPMFSSYSGQDMAEARTVCLLLLLLMMADTVLSTHFRGGIIMTRPLPGGSQNEVSD